MLRRAPGPILPKDAMPSASMLCATALPPNMPSSKTRMSRNSRKCSMLSKPSISPLAYRKSPGSTNGHGPGAFSVLRALETGLFNLRMCDLSKQTQITYKQLSDAERQAFVFLDDSRHAGAIENLSRYETRIERSFYRALRELQRLRKNRGAGLQPASPQAESRIEPGSATPAPLSTDAVPSPDSRLLNSDVSGLLIPDSALPATRASRSSYEFCRTKPIPSGKGTGTEAERESEEPQVSRMRRSAGV